ncbi:hypothetical protein SRHO_G00020650 [Serrasalmus rhombeus]
MCPKECKHVRQKERVQVSHRAFSPTQWPAKGNRSAHSGLNPVRTHKKCPHSITSVRVKAGGTQIDSEPPDEAIPSGMQSILLPLLFLSRR